MDLWRLRRGLGIYGSMRVERGVVLWYIVLCIDLQKIERLKE